MLSWYNSVPKYGKSTTQYNYDNVTYGNIVHQHSQAKNSDLVRQGNHGNVMLKAHYQGYNKDRSNEGLHHRYSNSLVSRQNLYCNQQSYSRKNGISAVIRKANFDNSLYPHGDPMPEDWIDSWDERPECPRTKWTYQENSSWQPPIKNQHGEYSGTELIKARGDDVLTTSFTHLNDFSANIRLKHWQVVSTKELKDTPVMTNATSDYETGDSNSDCSSVKSGSSVDWSPRKCLGALW